MDLSFIGSFVSFFSSSWIVAFIFLTYIIGLIAILIMSDGNPLDETKKLFLTWGAGVTIFISIPHIFQFLMNHNFFAF